MRRIKIALNSEDSNIANHTRSKSKIIKNKTNQTENTSQSLNTTKQDVNDITTNKKTQSFPSEFESIEDYEYYRFLSQLAKPDPVWEGILQHILFLSILFTIYDHKYSICVYLNR